MSFRCRQSLQPVAAFPTHDYILQPDKKGHVRLKKVSNNDKLPPPETTDLQTQLEQGVNLQQVNTVVLGNGSFDFRSIQAPAEESVDHSDSIKGE